MSSTGTSPAAIEVESLSKEYELGGSEWGNRSLYDSLAALARLGRSHRGRDRDHNRFLALDGVSFRVEPGEVIGVVGRNGAGKSTLLKILSRITAPSAGRALLRGNLASLLEVGTGFHPELSGRENIYLNGTILGMSRREIERKFDEIVDFAEISQFLDTPVKRYSSGMYVRLAFSVAAHLDADILLVDEVLAVGDAAFQRKSLGKMGSVATSGRTVLFVSHNLGAVRSLCRKVLVLEKGRLSFDGQTEAGLKAYEKTFARSGGDLSRASFEGTLKGTIEFERFELRQGGQVVHGIDPTLPLEIVLQGRARRSLESIDVTFVAYRDGARLFTCHDGPSGRPLREGEFTCRFRLPSHLLRPGAITVGFGAHRGGHAEWVWCADAAQAEIVEHWDSRLEARDEGAIDVDFEAERSQ